MDTVLVVKWIHILSATVLFGTGMGTAFHGLASNLRRDLNAIAVANRNVVLADWLFTTPAVIIQPLTGFYLAWATGWSFTEGWIVWSLALYVFVGMCWLPVVWLQVRMQKMADEAVREGTPLPERYHRYFRIWFALGWPAFGAMLVIFWLMVAKPQL